MEPSDRDLLERHAPLLRYDRQTAYRVLAASAATDWPRNALRRRDGRALAVRGGDPDLSLATLTAYPGGEPAERGDHLDLANEYLDAAQRFQADPAYVDRAYGRVVRDGERTWLQYWLFYYYNPHALLGFARHEGDWELIQVRLGAEGEPEAVTYAQHTFGQALRWDETERHPAPGGHHPVVYVAPLSNASYPEAGTFPYLGGVDHPRGDGDEVLVTVQEVRALGVVAGALGELARCARRAAGRHEPTESREPGPRALDGSRRVSPPLEPAVAGPQLAGAARGPRCRPQAPRP